MTDSLTFERLVRAIQAADTHFSAQAVRAVNLGLTLRNWCFGLYIAEFELRGADRAGYGEHLLNDLSDALKQLGISNVGRRQLYQYLTFYRTYPQIVRSLPALSPALLAESSGLQEIMRSRARSSYQAPTIRQVQLETREENRHNLCLIAAHQRRTPWATRRRRYPERARAPRRFSRSPRSSFERSSGNTGDGWPREGPKAGGRTCARPT
jgi:hypothetical protein